MRLQAIVAICLSIVQPLLCYDGAKGTLGNPILEYLKMDANNVEYELVPVLHAIQDRSPENLEPTQIHFKAFGKDYKLSLKPTEGLFKSNGHVPMWAVTRDDSEPDGLHYEEIEEASTDVGDLYQDPATMSSILLHYDSAGQVQVEGSIGSDLVIRSLPVQVLRQVVDDTKGLDDPDSLPAVTSRERRSLRLTNHHVVIKRSSQSMDEKHSDFMLLEPDHSSERLATKKSFGASSRFTPPPIVYPEILCLIDYETYRFHGGNDAQTKRYFMVFWNGVDLRYKLIKNPEIRLNIAGFVISKERGLPFHIENNKKNGLVNASGVLNDMGEYLFREKKLPVFDLAMALTALDLCSNDDGETACSKTITGLAGLGAACVVREHSKIMDSVGVAQDTGSFDGILTAAHELAHLLGVTHDGKPAPQYLGGLGGTKCPWADGYIMSYIRKNENLFKWSPCSIASFRHFLNTETAAKCLYDAPHNSERLPATLPGAFFSLDEQCKRRFGTGLCDRPNNNICLVLYCTDPGNKNECVPSAPASEGSPCGNRMHCIAGRCVAKR